MPQESLLADTKAILRGTVEWQHYRGGFLVRYKTLQGFVTQKRFKDASETDTFFWEQVQKLREEIKSGPCPG